MVTETATQAIPYSHIITIPQQLMVQTMEILMQQVIHNSDINFMIKEVIEMNTILE